MTFRSLAKREWLARNPNGYEDDWLVYWTPLADSEKAVSFFYQHECIDTNISLQGLRVPCKGNGVSESMVIPRCQLSTNTNPPRKILHQGNDGDFPKSRKLLVVLATFLIYILYLTCVAPPCHAYIRIMIFFITC